MIFGAVLTPHYVAIRRTKIAFTFSPDGHPRARAVTKGGEQSVDIRVGRGGTMTLQVKNDGPFDISIGTCPDNPANRRMSFIKLYHRAKQTAWNNRLMFNLPDRKGK